MWVTSCGNTIHCHVIACSYWFFVPESPRWLLSYGYIDEAEVIVQSIAKWNGKEISPNFVHEWIEREERKKALKAENAAAAAAETKRPTADAPPTPPPSPPAVTTPASAAHTAAALNNEVSANNDSSRKRISRSERDPSMLVLLWYYPVARRNFLLITFNWDVQCQNFSRGIKLKTASLRSLINCYLSTGLFIRSRKRCCKMFSESSFCFLGQHGSCSTGQRPLELSENILQNLSHDLMNNPVH